MLYAVYEDDAAFQVHWNGPSVADAGRIIGCGANRRSPSRFTGPLVAPTSQRSAADVRTTRSKSQSLYRPTRGRV